MLGIRRKMVKRDGYGSGPDFHPMREAGETIGLNAKKDNWWKGYATYDTVVGEQGT